MSRRINMRGIFCALAAVSAGTLISCGGSKGGGSNPVSPVQPANPAIVTISPDSATIGAELSVAGSGFGSLADSGIVTFAPGIVVHAAACDEWTAVLIRVKIPAGAVSGNVTVSLKGVTSNGIPLTIISLPAPVIASLTPASVFIGDQIIITGSNFGSSNDSGSVVFTPGIAVSSGKCMEWTASEIKVAVPVGVQTGTVVVSVHGQQSNGENLTIHLPPAPVIASLAPDTVAAGSDLLISGGNFDTLAAGDSVVFAPGIAVSGAACAAWTATYIEVTVPVGAQSGNVYVVARGQRSNNAQIAVTLWKTYAAGSGLGASQVYAIAPDSHGNVWFGTNGGGVSRFDGAGWTTYSVSDGLASNTVYAVAVDSQGVIWCGTSAGVSRFDGSSWETFTVKDGLADNDVSAISAANDGTLWFGTASGVSTYNGSAWKTFTTANGLASNSVRAVTFDAKGGAWVATGGGVSYFNGTTWASYTTANGLPNNSVFGVSVDKQGNAWCATFGGGIALFDGAHWNTYTTGNGLAGNNARAIAIDNAGVKWIATTSGVSRFDGSAWTTYTTADGLADDIVYTAIIDRSGNKWFGTLSGASRYSGN